MILAVTPIEFAAGSYYALLLVVTATLWGIFGTILIRGSCFALTTMQARPHVAGAERERMTRNAAYGDDIVMAEFADQAPASLPLKTPSLSRAFGITFVNALVIGVAAIAIVSLKAAIESDGTVLHPAQIGGLIVAAVLVGVAILWINREALNTSWLNSFLITATYLLGTLLLTAFFFCLLQLVTNLIG